MNSFTSILQALIAQNKIKLVMAVLTDFWHDKNQTAHNACLLFRSQWLQAEYDFSAGLIDRNEVTRVMNRVKMGLMHQVEEIAVQPFHVDEAMKRAAGIQNQFAEREVPVPKGKKTGWWVWFLLLPLIAVCLWLGKDLVTTAQPTGTVPQFTPLLTLKDTLAEVKALCQQADNLIRNNQEEEALVLISKAVALQQLDANLYNQRADLYFKLGRYPQAENDAERAIRLNPNGWESYVTIAQIMTKRGKTDAFYDNLEKALQINDGKSNVWQYDELPGIIEHRNEPRFRKLKAAYPPPKNQ